MPLFESAEQMRKGRRAIQRRTLLLGAAAGVGAVFFYRWWRRQPQKLSQRPTRYITPNRDFYTISISPAYPDADPARWRLNIDRDGKPARQFSLSELSALDSRRITRTLSCISNRVGGTAIGNAEWTVTPLGPLLERLFENGSTASRVVFHGLDGFYSSVPLEVALDAETFLAFEMNGSPLPREHGYPLRVLLPDRYGMKQPRWLQRIELTDGPVSGYWESRGWSNEARIRSSSRIDSVRPLSGGLWRIQGVAFCGADGVGVVEVSEDGEAWRQAELTSEALPGCWATWQFDWSPAARGRRILAVRVSNRQGEPQEEQFSGTFPSGASGLHRVTVDV